MLTSSLTSPLLRDATPYPQAAPAGWIVEPSSFFRRALAEAAVFAGRLVPLPLANGVRRYLCLSPECQCERVGGDCEPGEHAARALEIPRFP